MYTRNGGGQQDLSGAFRESRCQQHLMINPLRKSWRRPRKIALGSVMRHHLVLGRCHPQHASVPSGERKLDHAQSRSPGLHSAARSSKGIHKDRGSVCPQDALSAIPTLNYCKYLTVCISAWLCTLQPPPPPTSRSVALKDSQ